ncbi:prolipoprotein diacylglyceryl transferase [Ruminococcaceae bacterium OttesenSCG-928-A16]|nr:prolipoprotein diacylglyceryl transferase [Ruminococcaceae bacterium OttesenSCG-928-A16]
MYNVEFPGLGLTLELNRVAFTVFGVDIYWYGVFIGVGMLLAVLFAFSQCKRFGIDADRLVDVVFIGLLAALACGRLYYIIFSDMPLANFFKFREGGIAIYGGIIGGFLGAAIGCKVRKVPVLPLFDLAGMGFLIGQGLGRWGNFFNQEAFGSNTSLPWGMFSNGTYNYLLAEQATLAAQGVVVDPNLPVHPTFLYESLWCALGFLLLFLYKNRRKFNGEIFLFYVMWYGLGRFSIEGLRTDSLMIKGLGLRVSQVVAISSVLVALMIWVFAKVKTRGKALVVPVVPPHTANVKLESGETVKISWPANDKQPTREQRLEMAKLVKQQENEPSEEPVVDKADENTKQNKAGAEEKPAEDTKEKPAEEKGYATKE